MLIEKRVPFKYLFGQIKYDLLLVLVMSVLTYSLKRVYGDQVPRIPVSLPAFLGTAISLLLSFKLSQSYERWWEARKVWGSIVNDSRSLVLQLMGFTRQPKNQDTTNQKRPDQEEEEGSNPELTARIKRVSYRQIAWSYALSRSLRQQVPMEFLSADASSANLLSSDDLQKISQHQNKPLALANLQVQDIAALHQEGYLNDYQQIQLDQTMTRLVASMGKAERIKNTVFPVTYRQILIGFIYIFLVIMSLALLELDSLLEIPLDIIISLPFFMIEKTARYMQDPFENLPTDTAMTTIAMTIERNIRQIWEDPTQLPEPVLTDKFYIL